MILELKGQSISNSFTTVVICNSFVKKPGRSVRIILNLVAPGKGMFVTNAIRFFDFFAAYTAMFNLIMGSEMLIASIDVSVYSSSSYFYSFSSSSVDPAVKNWSIR